MKNLDHIPVTGVRVYRNPITFSNNPKQVNPDPYILRSRGLYYCYATGHDGVNLSISEDLVNWRYLGYAVSEPERQDYWAPAVVYHNGTYYMYCSNVARGDEDCHHEFLRVYTGESPAGPFLCQRTLFDKFSIDAHVVRDADGAFYLFYSVNDYMGTDENWAGTSILCDRLLDMETPEGGPLPVVVPSMTEEVFAADRFGDGRNWHTVEGAFYLERHGKAYVMYSANAYTSENYFLGVCTAGKDADPRALAWSKVSENAYRPLVCRSSAVEGTGHNSVVLAPNLVDTYIAYHGREHSEPFDPQLEQRRFFIDPLFFDNDRMVVSAPSSQDQPAPFLPAYSDRFGTFGTPWKTVEGRFEAKDHALCIPDTKGRAAAVLPDPGSFYLLEVDAACTLSSLGGEYGVLGWYRDGGNFLKLQFHAGRRSVSLLLARNGVVTRLASRPLPGGFDFQAYHTVLFRRAFSLFSAELDGISLFAAAVDVPTGPAGLFGAHTAARFCGLSLTKTVDLWGGNLPLFSRLFRISGSLYACEAGLENTTFQSVALRSLRPVKEDSVQQMTYRLDGDGSALVCRPAVSENGDGFIVTVRGRQCTVTWAEGRERTQVAAFTLEHQDFTVRSTVHAGKCWLLVSDHVTDAFPFPAEGYGIEAELTRGAVTQYACTLL